jgi:hypothetical protein
MFQKEVSEIIGYMNSINAEMDEVSKEYTMIKEIKEKVVAGQDLGENERTVVEALMHSCDGHLENIKKTQDSAHNSASKMNRKMWRVRLLAPGSEEKVREVAKKVLKGVSSVEEKIDSLKKRFEMGSGEDKAKSLET